MTKCPECDKELKYKKIEHWSGNNTWVYCPVCEIEILDDLELRELKL